MKLNKLIVIALALLMVVCAFAACGTPDETNNPDVTNAPDTEHVHNYVDAVVIAPTCSTIGKSMKWCSCGDTLEGSEMPVPLLMHDATEVTCTEDAVCGICGHIGTVAPGHTWAEEVWTVVTAPTTEADGVKSRECSVCGTVTEAILRKEEVKPMLYLTPNANWKVDGARFAAYFFDNGEKWVSMTYNSELGVYEVEVPAGYPKVIFCRMNPNATANNWDNRWNQTADLTVPTNGNNHYTVKENTWDKGGGTWDKLTVIPEHECVYYPATCTVKQTCYQCGATYGEALPHVDADKDHNCDYNCGKTFSTHVAAEGTHVCEYCGGVVTQCADNDNDHN